MQKKDVLKSIEYYCTKETNNICPFSHEKCKKVGRADLGVCSLYHNGNHQIICPNLFSKINFVKLVAKRIIGTDNVDFLKEFKAGNNFIDYIVVDKNDPSNYFGLEIQALDTSGNYRWLFGNKVKPFCINWKTTKKTIVSQLISKAQIFKKAKKHLVLLIQDTFLNYLEADKYLFSPNKLIHICSLKYDGNKFVYYSFHSLNVTELNSLLIESEFDLNKAVVEKFTK